MDFTLIEPLNNLSYLLTLAMWLLALAVWRYYPGFLGLSIEVIRQPRAEHSLGGVTHAISFGLLRFLVYLLSSGSLSLIALRIAIAGGYLQTGGYLYLLGLWAIGAAACYAFLQLRALAFRGWRRLILNEESGGLLRQDYFCLDWLRSLLLAGGTLLSLSSLTPQVQAAIVLGILALIHFVGIVQVIRRLSYANDGYLLLFLYLCAHEISPLIYFILGGSLMIRSYLLPL